MSKVQWLWLRLIPPTSVVGSDTCNSQIPLVFSHEKYFLISSLLLEGFRRYHYFFMAVSFYGLIYTPRTSLDQHSNRPTLSRCFSKRWAVSILCRRCSSSMTRSVSRAWCGRNSLTRWWMWMNNRLRSSTLAVRWGESGHRTSRSSKSRKLTNSEWFSLRNSRFLS